jgi:hypothetical protein
LCRYFLNDLEMVPVSLVITGITFVFTFHIYCIYIVITLYVNIFSASFLITFLYSEIAMSINRHVPYSLPWIMVSGLLLRMVLSVFNGWFHDMVTLLSWLGFYDFGTCSYQCPLSNLTPIPCTC